ncbi:MAG: hypothetical protein JWR61_5528, partial [Ferruginibacter sp.]|uniref:hypothetical protein n=1 Tax=Ferruginibacter sp. TaxID=1940288 RepID=UPI002659978B
MKPKWISVFFFNLLCLCCSAQTAGYKYFSLLDTVKQSSFYNIVFTPEISARVKTDYSDIRIVNKEGKWVPHLLVLSQNIIQRDLTPVNLSYEIIANSKVNTIVTIKSPGGLTS